MKLGLSFNEDKARLLHAFIVPSVLSCFLVTNFTKMGGYGEYQKVVLCEFYEDKVHWV